MLTGREPGAEKSKLAIAWLWCLTDGPVEGEETLLPSGRVQIIFSLSGAALHRDALHIMQGPSSRPRRVSRQAQAALCGASFHPGGAGTLFGPIDRTVDKVIDLATFWRSDAARLGEELRALETHEARLDHLESAIESRLGDVSAMILLHRALAGLRQGLSIKHVADALALSPHLFRKLFLRNVGLTPKHYLRIERFRAALERLTPETSLSALAFAAQFADQPHLTREISHFSARTPARLKASDRPHAGHIVERKR